MLAVATKTKRKRKIVLSPKDNGRRMKLDEFTDAVSSNGRLYELNRGIIVMAEVPRLSHGQIILIIRKAIYRYEDEHPGVIHYTAGGSEGKVMSEAYQSERHPDFMIYLHAAPNDKQPWAEWVPEIVVEVVSESSSKRDYEEKPPEYAEIGITEYLIVDPFKQKVVVNTRSRGATWKPRTLKPGQHYETRLLPGFKFDVRTVLAAGK